MGGVKLCVRANDALWEEKNNTKYGCDEIKPRATLAKAPHLWTAVCINLFACNRFASISACRRPIAASARRAHRRWVPLSLFFSLQMFWGSRWRRTFCPPGGTEAHASRHDCDHVCNSAGPFGEHVCMPAPCGNCDYNIIGTRTCSTSSFAILFFDSDRCKRPGRSINRSSSPHRELARLLIQST